MKTVADYIAAGRVLLQDVTPAPRYLDSEWQLALDLALDEAYRVRPDFFLNIDVKSVISQPLTYEPPVPRGYQSAFLYYMCGHIQLRDGEEQTDGRSTVFLNKFISQLLTTAA